MDRFINHISLNNASLVVCLWLWLTGRGCWENPSGGSGCSATFRPGGATHGSPQTAWCEACRCHPCTGSNECKRYTLRSPQLNARVDSKGWCALAYSLWKGLQDKT